MGVWVDMAVEVWVVLVLAERTVDVAVMRMAALASAMEEEARALRAVVNSRALRAGDRDGSVCMRMALRPVHWCLVTEAQAETVEKILRKYHEIRPLGQTCSMMELVHRVAMEEWRTLHRDVALRQGWTMTLFAQEAARVAMWRA
jgi:hypothetical protein